MPPPQQPTPSSSTIQVQTQTAPVAAPTVGEKLRDSCHACSASKLKCSREKPTCARCAKRDRVCEYRASRRAGRIQTTGAKSNNSSNINNNNNKWSNTTVGHRMPTAAPVLDTNISSLMSVGYDTRPTQFTDLLFHDLESMVSCPDAFMSQFDTPFVSHSDFTGSPGTSHYVDAGHLDMHSMDMEPFPSPLDATVDVHVSKGDEASIFNAPLIDSPSASAMADPESRLSISAHGESSSLSTSEPDTFIDHVSGCCLVRVLCMLRVLSPKTSLECANSRASTLPLNNAYGTRGHVMTIESIIEQNKRIMETMSSILLCTCSRNGFVLGILTHVVFKTLCWYEAYDEVAGDTYRENTGMGLLPRPTSLEQARRGPVFGEGYHVDDQDRKRMAAHLVLSELTRIQGLVNILSQRLHDVKRGASQNEENGMPDNDVRNGDVYFPLSSALLDVLELDLRKCLRGLSARISQKLRL